MRKKFAKRRRLDPLGGNREYRPKSSSSEPTRRTRRGAEGSVSRGFGREKIGGSVSYRLCARYRRAAAREAGGFPRGGDSACEPERRWRASPPMGGKAGNLDHRGVARLVPGAETPRGRGGVCGPKRHQRGDSAVVFFSDESTKDSRLRLDAGAKRDTGSRGGSVSNPDETGRAFGQSFRDIGSKHRAGRRGEGAGGFGLYRRAGVAQRLR